MEKKNGRPAMYDNPEEMRVKIEEYFNKCISENKHITITGLCLFLGFESRQSFYDYGKKEDFAYIIKKARLMVEHGYEIGAMDARNPTFHIFALKNMGWSDKQEIDHTSGGDKMQETKIIFT